MVRKNPEMNIILLFPPSKLQKIIGLIWTLQSFKNVKVYFKILKSHKTFVLNSILVPIFSDDCHLLHAVTTTISPVNQWPL